MKSVREALWAYLATLFTIALLSLVAAVIVIASDFGTPETLAKVIGALAFLGSAVTGLIGVIGTFRPRAREQADGGA